MLWILRIKDAPTALAGLLPADSALVRAESEDEARSKIYRDQLEFGIHAWLDAELSTCDLLDPDGDEAVIASWSR